MRREYGSRLFKRIDAPITGELIAEIYADVVEALFNYEPRFEATNVTVVQWTTATWYWTSPVNISLLAKT